MSAANIVDIGKWFEDGRQKGMTHMVIVCDTFDYDDYPVYCTSAAEALQKFDHPGEMQRAMECYDLNKDFEEQVNRPRCYEF